MCNSYAPLKDLQLEYMTEYEIHDCGIHVASYADGVQIIGNFTETPQIWEGCTVPAWGIWSPATEDDLAAQTITEHRRYIHAVEAAGVPPVFH